MMGFFPKPEPWMLDAACARVDHDLFFPDRGDGRGCRDAKAICAGCPVVDECREYAQSHKERFGVWGGQSEYDRRKAQKPASTEVAA